MSITEICIVDGCDTLEHTKKTHGYCMKHWAKYRKYGDPLFRKVKAPIKVHPLYITWRSMKTRCYKSSHKAYHYYGGRGITVCDRWLSSFTNFLDDMGEKPTKYHTLDRIDNNGNYEPSNCRWATPDVQALNTRRNLSQDRMNIVQMKGGRLKVMVERKGKNLKVGTFATQEDAIKARDEFVSQYSY